MGSCPKVPIPNTSILWSHGQKWVENYYAKKETRIPIVYFSILIHSSFILWLIDIERVSLPSEWQLLACVSNYFSLPAGTDKIQSVVTVDYQVFLPEKVNLVINNEFGSCIVDNLDAFVNLNNKYGDILLNRVKGQFRVFATLCDIQMNNFSGNFELYSSNSDIIMKNINGGVKVNNKVGTMILEPGEDLEFLTVNSTN